MGFAIGGEGRIDGPIGRLRWLVTSSSLPLRALDNNTGIFLCLSVQICVMVGIRSELLRRAVFDMASLRQDQEGWFSHQCVRCTGDLHHHGSATGERA